MPANYFAAAPLLLIVSISARTYDHRDRRYAKDKNERIESPSSFVFVYRLIQATTLLFGLGSMLTDHWLLFELHDDAALAVAGSLLALTGFAVFLSAKSTLGRHYSPCFDSFVPNQVVREGVYARVRHPIYTANFLIVGGIAVASGSLWLALNLALLVVYYTLSAMKEETALADQFPEYRTHMRCTGRFFPRFSPVRNEQEAV